jgi:hypothetical protein
MPALIGASRGMTSVSPLMITRPALVVRLETLCEASTRSYRPLGGLGMEYPPKQEMTLTLASAIKANRAAFFKLHAPNYRQTGDLSAK